MSGEILCANAVPIRGCDLISGETVIPSSLLLFELVS
jgi:hypothetical protein